jgi:hypothetical protein
LDPLAGTVFGPTWLGPAMIGIGPRITALAVSARARAAYDLASVQKIHFFDYKMYKTGYSQGIGAVVREPVTRLLGGSLRRASRRSSVGPPTFEP